MSNSVIQRYTPPTCTLEIKGKSSPLSRWVGQTVVKDLQFDLRFDDPRKSDESRISVKGDRAGLEKLCDAVTTYVQDFLSSKGTDLPLSIWGGQSAAEDDNGGNLLSLAPPFVKTAESVTSSDSEGDNYLNHQPETSNLRQFPGKIYLEPKGLVSHNLYLGHLANSESGPVVELSVLQLFDLATALDEYAAQMVALPNLKRTRQEQKPPAWSWVAASMVLGVGIATGTIEWRSQDRQVQQATGPKAEQSTPAPAPTPTIAQAPIPSPPSPLPTPVTPTPLALAPKILPPTPVQPPAIPNSSPSPSTQNQGSKRQDLIISNPGAASQTTPTRQTPNPGQPVPPRQV
ncbi:MAG TPA: hypothetical protein DEG17_23925, partial [Cyanobacteria bacterium UBA11149]|nr:hypothetical protein [Cyanobacteria bacterium UBA11149]